MTGLVLYRSRDGRNWVRLSASPCAGTPAAATSTVLYLVCIDGLVAGSPGSWGGGDAGIYACLDGGEHWATAYAGRFPYGITELSMTTATQGSAIDSGSVLLIPVTPDGAGRRPRYLVDDGWPRTCAKQALQAPAVMARVSEDGAERATSDRHRWLGVRRASR